MISPHMPSAGPRRSASDHAHIATWFCIFPVYPALPHFAAYASPGGGAASPGLQRTACSPTLPSFSPALHIISPHMPSRKTAPFRIRLCTYHNMILRLSVYVSSVEQCINLRRLLLCQAVLRTTLWRRIAQPRRSASRFDALSVRPFKLTVSRAS